MKDIFSTYRQLKPEYFQKPTYNSLEDCFALGSFLAMLHIEAHLLIPETLKLLGDYYHYGGTIWFIDYLDDHQKVNAKHFYGEITHHIKQNYVGSSDFTGNEGLNSKLKDTFSTLDETNYQYLSHFERGYCKICAKEFRRIMAIEKKLGYTFYKTQHHGEYGDYVYYATYEDSVDNEDYDWDFPWFALDQRKKLLFMKKRSLK